MIQAAIPKSNLGSFRAAIPSYDLAETEFPARPLPVEWRFALIFNPHFKPFAFPQIEDLARSIHRRRAGAPIELFSTRVPMVWRPEKVRVVRVTVLNDGMRHRLIGFAWLGGHRQGQQDLRAALYDSPSTFSGAA